MRKIILAVLTIFMAANMASAQNLLKYNYKKNNHIYTGAERVTVKGPSAKDDPIQVKLSRVIFEDGQPVYILRLDFMEATAWKMPKNAPLNIVTTEGRTISLKNSADSPNLVAPKGTVYNGSTVFLNYGEYYLEEADMKKVIAGITSIEATKRWSSDGVIKISYKNNELGSAISQQYNVIKNAPKPGEELGSNLKSLQDQAGSRLVESNTIKVNNQLSVSLVYLYYASSNTESIDLNLYLPGVTVPFTYDVKITTKSGEVYTLQQEKELPAGRVICYPTSEQLKEMAKGVTKVSVQTKSGEVVNTFTANEFGKAVDKLYNSLQTLAIL